MVSPTTGKKLAPFSRDKLFVSIFESCKHRPKGIDDAAFLTQTVINDFWADGAQSALLHRNHIVHTVYQVLDRFDPTAAALYRAYHPL